MVELKKDSCKPVCKHCMIVLLILTDLTCFLNNFVSVFISDRMKNELILFVILQI